MTFREVLKEALDGKCFRHRKWKTGWYVRFNGFAFIMDDGRIFDLEEQSHIAWEVGQGDNWELYEPKEYMDFPSIMKAYLDGHKVTCDEDSPDCLVYWVITKNNSLTLFNNLIQSKKWRIVRERKEGLKCAPQL